MHHWVIILFQATTSLLLLGAGSLPSTRIDFSNVRVDYDFNRQAVFQAQIEPDHDIKSVSLSIQPEGSSTYIQKASVDADGMIFCQVDLKENSIPFFSRVEYWYRIELTSGEEVNSEKYAFDYVDNRYPWQTMQNSRFQINWYDGSISFGQAVFDSAQASLESAQIYLQAPPPEPVSVYVYPNPLDLQEAVQLDSQTWVAGHATPRKGVILISIAPGVEQNLEMERQIPHEMMHVLQYQVVGEAFDRMPVWLIEGMASLAEMYPNPDYQRVLDQAARDGQLIPLSSLCKTFPQASEETYLAYAESASFTRAIFQKYGSPGLLNLMLQYQSGVGCKEGFPSALGISMEQIESEWKRNFLKVNTNLQVVENLAPYLLLAALFIFIPLASGWMIRKTFRQVTHEPGSEVNS